MSARTIIASRGSVGVRLFDENDADFLASVSNDPAIQRLAAPFPALPTTPSTFAARLSAEHRAPYTGSSSAVEFAVVKVVDDVLAPIGVAGLYRIDQLNGNAEVGISITCADERRKGFGFESHVLLISYAFDHLNLHRIYGHVKASNLPANRLCEKLGMQLEGKLRDHRAHDGAYEALNIYGILRSEWSFGLTGDRPAEYAS